MKISIRKLIWVSLYIVFLVIELVVIQSAPSFLNIAILSICNFVLQIFIFLAFKIRLFSIGPVFILLGQIFELGDIILYAMDYNFSEYILIQLNRVSEADLLKAANFSLLCFNTIFLGFIFGVNIKKNKQSRGTFEEYSKELSVASYRSMGIALVIIFGSVWSVVQIANFALSRYGYVVNVYHTLPSTVITLSNFLYVGIFMLMIYYKEQKKDYMVKFWFTVELLCAGISMLAGVRSTGMCIIILLFIYYDLCIHKISKKRIIVLGITALILLALLTAIMHTRKSDFSIANLLVEWGASLKSNVLMNALEEFGMSIFSLTHEVALYNAGTYTHVPINIFLHELVVSIPGLSTLMPDLVPEGYIILGLSTLGGSYVADFYYYLGYGGVVFSLFFGGYLSFIDNKSRKYAEQKNYYALCTRWVFYILILSEIRSPFRIGYKTLILSIFLMRVMKKFFSSRMRRENIEL